MMRFAGNPRRIVYIGVAVVMTLTLMHYFVVRNPSLWFTTAADRQRGPGGTTASGQGGSWGTIWAERGASLAAHGHEASHQFVQKAFVEDAGYGKSEPKTQQGKVIQLLNPYKYEDDPAIECHPLASANRNEPICTYSTKEDEYISKVLNANHVWESDVVNALISILKKEPAMGLIDIGTNLGIFTITAASFGHQVVGVEPYPPNLQRLSKSLRKSPHLMDYIKVVPNATSDQYQTMKFWTRDKHPGGTQLHSEEKSKKLGPGTTHHEKKGLSVETIKVDDLIPLLEFNKAILKIDIEGGEYLAFQGANKLFQQIDIPYVFMEWDNKGKHLNWRKFFINFFSDRNYLPYTSNKSMKPLEMSEEASKTWPFDVVFKRTSKKVETFFTQQRSGESNLRTELKTPISVLEPYQVKDDANIACVPLREAKEREVICTYTKNEDEDMSNVLSGSQWEPETVQVMKFLLEREREMGVIDMGAGIGFYTLMAASYGHQVVAVEPYPPSVQRLAKSLRASPQLTPKIKVVTNALWYRYEDLKLWTREAHPGATQVHSRDERAEAARKNPSHKEQSSSVTAIKTNDLLTLITFNKAILKVNIEGSEYNMLQSADKLFKEIDIAYVFFEWGNKCQDLSKRGFFIEFFKERGYTVHKTHLDMEKLELSEDGCASWPSNVIFMKNG